MATLLAAAVQCTTGSAKEPASGAKHIYQRQLQEFARATDSLVMALRQHRAANWRAAFQKARMAYKKAELLADYYYPSTAKAINGPPVNEVEADDPFKIVEPSGFQVMEERLFPAVDTAAQADLLVQARMLQSLALRLLNGLQSLELTESHLFDAARLQLLRISAIGITGADNGIAQNSIAEAAVSLQSLTDYLLPYSPPASFASLVRGAIQFAETQTSFAGFDRATFLVDYIRPLWHELYLLQTKRGIPFLKETGLVNTALPQLFAPGFFDAASFNGLTGKPSAEVVQFGRQLFADGRLSGNGRRSCASCHQPQKAYTDNLPKNSSIDGRSVIFRNTPTVLYAALQPVQFADGRLSFLEDQAKAVIENHSEMKGDLKTIAAALSADTAWQQRAKKAFGKTVLKEEDITKALAAFIRSLSPFTSPFDAFLQGNKKALTAEAAKGFTLFMGKAKCGTCHFMPLFNGVVPPHFSKMESEIIGVPQTAEAPFRLDGDEGRYRFTQSPVHRFAFKTPTLRNVALTAPYMHNGVYKTLEEVMEFYDKGGAAGLGISLPGQTLPAEPLHLSKEEKSAILQFLHSLTDR